MSSIETPSSSSVGALTERIAAIERALEANSYRPGPWMRLVADVRALPQSDRVPLVEDLSRVSRRLHLRNAKYTMSASTGYVIEAVFAVIGAILLGIGLHKESNVLVVIATVIWVVAFQPLIKVGVGQLFGIGYEYAYLYGIEPRFKMRFGEYLALPRYARLVLHLSGMIGSPLGAVLPIAFMGSSLWVARDVCWLLFWVLVATNVVTFGGVLTGTLTRVGPMRLADGSGGAAAIELREALEIRGSTPT
jgi:hypothetical protein